MPHRRPTSAASNSIPRKRPSFRKQYDEMEAHRAALCVRLQALGHAARRHPAHKGALKLLNNIYRKEKLPQRLAVLQSAAWLISILEKLSSSI
ncbi:MAG TPA: hypothetical protein VFP60_19160 [Pseudolabrys sp.]|nr:hypothetical protein [Pseudolabrys sp.]